MAFYTNESLQNTAISFVVQDQLFVLLKIENHACMQHHSCNVVGPDLILMAKLATDLRSSLVKGIAQYMNM